ncbi:MAG: sialidase, partial [Pedobacter sp.]
MKRSYSRLALLVISLMTMTSSYSQIITFEQYRLPVLIGRERNPVAGLIITSPGDQAVNLTSLNIRLISSAKGAVTNVTLLSLGQDSASLADTKMGKATRTGSAVVNNSGVVIISGSAPLKKGKNYFVITVGVNGTPSLFDSMNVRVTQARIGKRKMQVKPPPVDIWQRMGTSVRRAGEENVVSHRIPGIATAKDGSLLSIYDARRLKAQDLQGDIDIGLSRSDDKGKTWQPMQVVLDMGEWGGLPQKFNGVSDACILVDKNTGYIYVAGLWMYGVIDKTGKWVENLTDTSTAWNHQWRDKGSQPGFDVKQTSQFLITKSTDNGKTWSEPLNLTKMCKKEEWWLWAPAPG